MAWMPCLRCDQRFNGEANNLYLTLYLGDEREAYRYVICDECLEALVAEWRQKALYRDEDGDWTYRQDGDDAVHRTARPAGPSEPRRRNKRPEGRDELPWR